jgi:hypothetical protein
MTFELFSIAVMIAAGVMPFVAMVPVAFVEVRSTTYAWSTVIGIATATSHARSVVACVAATSDAGTITAAAASHARTAAIASAPEHGSASAIAATAAAAATAITTAPAAAAPSTAITATTTALAGEVHEVGVHVGRKLEVERWRGAGDTRGENEAAGESRHRCQIETHLKTSI